MTFQEKMAKKAFEDPKFQQSWQVHMGAFGPILAGCLKDDYTAKIHLCAALNHISRREGQKGREKLKQIESRCQNEQDLAALFFFWGLSHQMEGDVPNTILWFREAIGRGLKFYMPYMKLAKFCQGGSMYEKAAEYYRGAIACYDGMGLGQGEKVIIGSAYTGLATCLTMMHRYEEAERALEASRRVCADGPGRSAVEAVLAAAQGQEEKAKAALDALLVHAPQVYEQTRNAVRGILAGEDPMFCPMEPDSGALAGFWDWFRAHEEEMSRELLEGACNGLFPQAEGGLMVLMEDKEVRLVDYHFTALGMLYEELLACCPEDIRERWRFSVIHEKPWD